MPFNYSLHFSAWSGVKVGEMPEVSLADIWHIEQPLPESLVYSPAAVLPWIPPCPLVVVLPWIPPCPLAGVLPCPHSAPGWGCHAVFVWADAYWSNGMVLCHEILVVFCTALHTNCCRSLFAV